MKNLLKFKAEPFEADIEPDDIDEMFSDYDDDYLETILEMEENEESFEEYGEFDTLFDEEIDEEIDLKHAVRLNRYYAKKLSWRTRLQEIETLLGAENLDPRKFARAVSGWQGLNNLTVDGILGPNTWRAMRARLPRARPMGGQYPATLAGLESFSRKHLDSSVGRLIDCADLAIETWILFGEASGVPVSFQVYDSAWRRKTGRGRYLTVDRTGTRTQQGKLLRRFRTIRQFIRYATKYIGARNLIDDGNTHDVDGGHAAATSGDVYLWNYWDNANPNSRSRIGHTQVFYQLNNNRITFVQGTLTNGRPGEVTKRTEDVSYFAQSQGGMRGYTRRLAGDGPRRLNSFRNLPAGVYTDGANDEIIENLFKFEAAPFDADREIDDMNETFSDYDDEYLGTIPKLDENEESFEEYDKFDTLFDEEIDEEIDLKRAVRLNRYYAKKLGWHTRYDKIEPFLGFTNYSPDEKTLAETIAIWQQRQGLKSDGIIGPNTWNLMKSVMSGTLNGTVLNTKRAIRLNQHYGKKLGWHKQLDKIEPFLGFTNYSPDEKTLAESVAKWQKSQSLKPDGVIGSNTWKRLQKFLLGNIDSVHGIDLNRAVIHNRRYRQRLGWHKQQSTIERTLLGFTDQNPNEKVFAQAVADWQENHKLSPTGIISMDTWEKMHVILKKLQNLWLTKPLPSLLEPELLVALQRFQRLVNAELQDNSLSRSNTVKAKRMICQLKKLQGRKVDDRQITMYSMCGLFPNQNNLFGTNPCQPSREQELYDANIRNKRDVDSVPASLGLIKYLKTVMLNTHFVFSDDSSALAQLKRHDKSIGKAINLLAKLDAIQRGAGLQRLPIYYVAIKDWIAERQNDRNSVYRCR